MTCGVEVTVRHRGNAWNTVHRCKMPKRHKGRHQCMGISSTGTHCPYRWARKRRVTVNGVRRRVRDSEGR